MPILRDSQRTRQVYGPISSTYSGSVRRGGANCRSGAAVVIVNALAAKANARTIISVTLERARQASSLDRDYHDESKSKEDEEREGIHGRVDGRWLGAACRCQSAK